MLSRSLRLPLVLAALLFVLPACGDDDPVSPDPQPPVVETPIPDQEAVADADPLTFDLDEVFSDPEGRTLSFEATSSDDGVASTAVTSAELTVSIVGEGTAEITVTATNDDGSTDTSFSVTVATPAQPPVIDNAIDDQEAQADDDDRTFDLNEVFSDPQDRDLTFDATSDDDEVVLAEVDGATLTLDFTGGGSATVTVTASNDDGSTDFTFAVDVTLPDPPGRP